MEPIWNQLYEAAKSALNPREVSRWIEAGGVAAAIETDAGNIYTGVCVDAACTLGICAERNAIFHMLTQGENALRRVVAVDREGKVLPPCGAYRELMTQLMPETYREVEILLDYDTGEAAKLGDLTPRWWL